MSRMMQQYDDAKAQHPGMLVLFRNGDFYERFKDDAELGSITNCAIVIYSGRGRV